MSGGLLLDANGLVIIGADAKTRFNANDGLFHVADQLSKVISFPAFNVGDGAGANRTDDVIVGTCHPACTDIIGSVKFSASSIVWSGAGGIVGSTGIPSGVYHTIVGGSPLVIYQDGHGPNTTANPNLGLYQMFWFYVFISAGVVKMRRRAWVSSSSQGSMSVGSMTATCKFKTSLFT